jgi:CBS domain containing-hemolysin-like protein
MTLVLIVLALLAVNALFVAGEFAVIGAPREAIEHRASTGDRLAARLHAVLDSPAMRDRYIATAQIGITLTSVGLGMYGEHTFAAWLEPRLVLPDAVRVVTAHTLASVLAIGGLTYLHIFLGEMVPKAVAISRAERTARAVYWPMRLSLLLLYPFVATLNATGHWLLHLIGLRRQPEAHDQGYTPEELQIIVEESARGGAIPGESASWLGELFEFGDLTAGQAMVPRVRVVGLPVGASPDAVKALMLAHHHTRYPIFDGDLDHIVGMLHVKDLLRRLTHHEPISADVRPMPVVPETARLDDVLATMQRSQAHMAVVIDEHGGTAGLITLEDLFEEVVGEIDEGVPSAPALAIAPDGSAIVAGTVRLDELGHAFDVDLEHEEVDSVSGLVLARLGRPAAVGDTVEYGRLRIEVTAVSGRGVSRARAVLLPPAAD